MKYCKRCLQPDTRPGIMFNTDGVCYACLYEESKKMIDWKGREKELSNIAGWAKEESAKRQNAYDCVIGVSGGKDSTYQAVYAKERLGLRPLLVNCAPDEITEVGRHNLDNLNRLSGGFDVISLRPNPVIAKMLAKNSFLERGNIVAASEYCLFASAYRIAFQFNIPLIIQGENAALTLGTVKNQDSSGNAFNVVELDTVRKFDLSELLEGTDLSEQDLYLYSMPDIEEMKKRGFRAIWLQYYVKEWSQVYNADFAVARGLLGRTSEDLHDLGRYRRFSALDSDLQIVNQMIKYYKFGFGFATDEACYDIREGRLSRDEAKWYVKEYDGQCGEKYITDACRYMGISKNEFYETLNKYVNKELFCNVEGEWKPKFDVYSA